MKNLTRNTDICQMIWPGTEGLTLAQAALRYAEHGWPVFPCARAGKRPITARGLHDATTDADQIRAWWARYPQGNIGVAIPPGYWVLDVDGPAGVASMRALVAEHGAMPSTATQRTARGWHLLFTATAGAIRNGTAWRPGVDTRGPGGYIVGAPSIHETGATYRTVLAGELAEPPSWLAMIVATPEREQMASPMPAPKDCSAWAATALDRNLAELAETPKGSRNAELNKKSFRLGRLIGAGMLDREHCVASLYATARAIGLRPAESRKTIASGMDSGTQHPHPGPQGAPNHV